MNTIKITLPEPKIVKALGNRDVEITEIEVFEWVDSPYKKTVVARCRNHPTQILLWEGEAYDEAGQWTEEQAANRILEIYS